jgi:hypothetical protein
MRLAGHIARMGEMRMHIRFWSETTKGKDYSKDVGVDEKIILEWILEKYGGKFWTGFIWFRVGISGGHL